LKRFGRTSSLLGPWCSLSLFIGSGWSTAFVGGFDQEVKPFLEAHCLDCHDADAKKGGLDLSTLRYDLTDRELRRTWVLVFDRNNTG
jgi:hypothetical protein